MQKISKAEFKRRLVPGTRLKCLAHKFPARVGETRTVEQFRSRDIVFRMPDGTKSYLALSVLDEVHADDFNLGLYQKNQPWLMFQILPPA